MRLTAHGGHPQTSHPTMPRHWLMKSEPAECSIDDLAGAAQQTLPWTGVRNYQARNFMRDDMQAGDGVLYYHSSCTEPGIAGLAQIAGAATSDSTQFDAASPYFDPKSKTYGSRWLQIDVRLVQKTRLLGLKEMRAQNSLQSMRVLQNGNRLSITPVSDVEWLEVLRLLGC